MPCGITPHLSSSHRKRLHASILRDAIGVSHAHARMVRSCARAIESAAADVAIVAVKSAVFRLRDQDDHGVLRDAVGVQDRDSRALADLNDILG